jgi:methylglutaconyl-CoA hydratase
MSAGDPLTVALEGGTLNLTLDRPEKRNALSIALIEALHAALDRADLDADVRVVVLRGAGRDFCAGADLDELLASADHPPADNEASALRLGTLFGRMRRLPKPIVSVVQGRALAGGAGLVMACDIAIAADGALIGYPEIQRGFVPAMVMTLLRRSVGEKVALDLVLTGRMLTAPEAVALGLIARTAPDEDLERVAGSLVADLAAASGSALALTKQLFYQLDGRSIDDGVALGARVNAAARETPDFRAAIARFLTR